jgi:hypothetical protein
MIVCHAAATAEVRQKIGPPRVLGGYGRNREYATNVYQVAATAEVCWNVGPPRVLYDGGDAASK